MRAKRELLTAKPCEFRDGATNVNGTKWLRFEAIEKEVGRRVSYWTVYRLAACDGKKSRPKLRAGYVRRLECDAHQDRVRVYHAGDLKRIVSELDAALSTAQMCDALQCGEKAFNTCVKRLKLKPRLARIGSGRNVHRWTENQLSHCRKLLASVDQVPAEWIWVQSVPREFPRTTKYFHSRLLFYVRRRNSSVCPPLGRSMRVRYFAITVPNGASGSRTVWNAPHVHREDVEIWDAWLARHDRRPSRLNANGTTLVREDEEFLTLGAAAKALRLDEATLRSWWRHRQVPGLPVQECGIGLPMLGGVRYFSRRLVDQYATARQAHRARVGREGKVRVDDAMNGLVPVVRLAEAAQLPRVVVWRQLGWRSDRGGVPRVSPVLNETVPKRKSPASWLAPRMGAYKNRQVLVVERAVAARYLAAIGAAWPKEWGPVEQSRQQADVAPPAREDASVLAKLQKLVDSATAKKNQGGRPEKYPGLVVFVDERATEGGEISWLPMVKEWNRDTEIWNADALERGEPRREKFKNARTMKANYYRKRGKRV